jgi:hypothetical protein
MKLTRDFISLRLADKVTFKPTTPVDQKEKVSLTPPPPPTHQPRYVERNREGPYNREESVEEEPNQDRPEQQNSASEERVFVPQVSPLHDPNAKPNSSLRVTSAAKDDLETRTYEVKGLPKHLDELEQLFYWMETLGHAGHSAKAEVFVDGDGNASLSFEGLTAGPPEIDEEAVDGPELRVDIS